jgi:hypothetical protein
MRRTIFRFIVAVAMSLSACGQAPNTPEPQGVVLEGLVTDKIMGGGIDGASIAISSLTTTSNADGTYRIEGLVEGVHELIIQADGYRLSREMLDVGKGEQSLEHNTQLVAYE